MAFCLPFFAVWLFITLSRCSQPSEAELKAQAEADVQSAVETKQREAFEARQQRLWAQPVIAITSKQLTAEVDKCRNSVSDWTYFSPWNADEALERIKAGIGSVTLTGQVRTPIGNVQSAEYVYHFRNSGFERLSIENRQFMDDFISE